VSDVSIVGIGLVTFSGGESVRGWTLSGSNVVIENVVFSNFQTTGLFGRISADDYKKRLIDVLRTWRSDRDQQRNSKLF
jgi:hypothetical protein